ncbi:MAG TPA: divalent-cation tolerance protein CutA [Candidatus Krumholzibacteria bacterium]|nr:divalent-cation tolerance protein CutA [Candidatus Krumholzibacteria bacterium]
MRSARGAFVQVLVAVPSARLAARLSRSLLQQRLCACAQTLGPVTSRYRWRGRLEQAREWLLLLKTRRVLLAAVEREIRRQHPYEVPEILALPVQSGSAPYLEWLQRECASDTGT